MSPTANYSPTNARFPHPSPTLPTSHAHPVSRRSSIPQSPARNEYEHPVSEQSIYNAHPNMNGSTDRPSSQGTIDDDSYQGYSGREEPKPTRKADPMSFSNILSNDAPEPPKSTPRSMPALKVFKSSSHSANGDGKTASAAPRKSLSKAAMSPKDFPGLPKSSVKADPDVVAAPTKATVNGKRKSTVLSDQENAKVEKEMAKIDAMELSDLDSPIYDAAKREYVQSSQKRQRAVEAAEDVKRKVGLPSFSCHSVRQADKGKSSVDGPRQQSRFRYSSVRMLMLANNAFEMSTRHKPSKRSNAKRSKTRKNARRICNGSAAVRRLSSNRLKYRRMRWKQRSSQRMRLSAINF